MRVCIFYYIISVKHHYWQITTAFTYTCWDTTKKAKKSQIGKVRNTSYTVERKGRSRKENVILKASNILLNVKFRNVSISRKILRIWACEIFFNSICVCSFVNKCYFNIGKLSWYFCLTYNCMRRCRICIFFAVCDSLSYHISLLADKYTTIWTK